jgi:hypothetical protein
MLSPRLTDCPECANIPSLLKKIDCKLAELGNNLYNNISYMLNKPIPAGDILQLIAYRRILTYKYCNPNYVHEYSVQMIASRVIRLTVGCVSRCNEPERCLEDPCDITIVPNPTTTSTSTSSTSSTTTTSTTAVPTTTTTSSSSTSTSTSSTSSTTTSTTTSGLTTTTSTTCSFNHPYNINLIENVTTGGGAVFIGSLIEACAAVSCLNSSGCLPSGLRIGYWDEAVPSVGDIFFANPTDCSIPSTDGWFAINIPGTPGSWQVVHMVNSIIQSYPTC